MYSRLLYEWYIICLIDYHIDGMLCIGNSVLTGHI